MLIRDVDPMKDKNSGDNIERKLDRIVKCKLSLRNLNFGYNIVCLSPLPHHDGDRVPTNMHMHKKTLYPNIS